MKGEGGNDAAAVSYPRKMKEKNISLGSITNGSAIVMTNRVRDFVHEKAYLFPPRATHTQLWLLKNLQGRPVRKIISPLSCSHPQ